MRLGSVAENREVYFFIYSIYCCSNDLVILVVNYQVFAIKNHSADKILWIFRSVHIVANFIACIHYSYCMFCSKILRNCNGEILQIPALNNLSIFIKEVVTWQIDGYTPCIVECKPYAAR